MHLSDSMISNDLILGGFVAAGATASLLLRRLEDAAIPRVAVLSSVFFIASLIHIPLPLGSAHLLLNGLIGFLVGYPAFIVVFVGVSFQAVLFGHGGPLAIGINSCVIGSGALLSAWLRHRFNFVNACGSASKTSRLPISLPQLAGLCAFLASFLSCLLHIGCLWYTGKELGTIYSFLIPFELMVSLLEGIIAFGIVKAMLKIHPELILDKTTDTNEIS